MKGFGKLLSGYCIILAASFGIIQLTHKSVQVLAENTLLKTANTIVIDPGHGGVDGGAISCAGTPESKINLEICLRLNDLLHFVGYPTVMIRTEDVSVYTTGDTIAQKKRSDLKERARLTNSTENPILLSIHQNLFLDSRYSGAQVFYAQTKGSQALAKKLQEKLVDALNPGSNRKEKRSSGVYLMEHIQCPGVLIECGFLSNPEEEAKLKTKPYQQKLCSVIVSAVSEYLSNT